MTDVQPIDAEILALTRGLLAKADYDPDDALAVSEMAPALVAIIDQQAARIAELEAELAGWTVPPVLKP